jgi:hypothetical protein
VGLVVEYDERGVTVQKNLEKFKNLGERGRRNAGNHTPEGQDESVDRFFKHCNFSVIGGGGVPYVAGKPE